MQVLRSGDYKTMPWKNGGGVTTEIAIFPPEAGLADFDWRVSMATVAEDGPFSVFAGIDRTLSIIEGAGMELSVAAHSAVVLDQQSDPFAFAGDAVTSAILTAGPIVDLNVMARRGRIAATVRRVHAGEKIIFPAGASLLLCHQGEVGLAEDDRMHALHALDGLRHDGTAPLACALVGDGTAFLISFSAI